MGGRKGVPRGRRADTTRQRKRRAKATLSELVVFACNRPAHFQTRRLLENSICKTVSRNFLRNSLAVPVVADNASRFYCRFIPLSRPRQTFMKISITLLKRMIMTLHM